MKLTMVMCAALVAACWVWRGQSLTSKSEHVRLLKLEEGFLYQCRCFLWDFGRSTVAVAIIQVHVEACLVLCSDETLQGRMVHVAQSQSCPSQTSEAGSVDMAACGRR